MSDLAPVVDFKAAPNPLTDLDLQRTRLTHLIEDVERSLKEVLRFEAEGEEYASRVLFSEFTQRTVVRELARRLSSA